jgi:DNA transformation protein
MLGGAGIFADGVMFGLVADDVIYLKADDGNADDFGREGLPPFQYQANNGKRVVMSYRKMPERLYDDPGELAQWASRSLAVAQREATPRTKRRPDRTAQHRAGGGLNAQATAAVGAVAFVYSGSVSQTTRLRPARFAA